MSFVPIIAATTPSPRAQELSHQLAGAIQAYRSSHPDLSDHEIAQALALAHRAQRDDGSGAAMRPVLLSALVGVAVVLGLVLTIVGRTHRGGAADDSEPWIVVAIGGIAAVLALVAFLVRLRRG